MSLQTVIIILQSINSQFSAQSLLYKGLLYKFLSWFQWWQHLQCEWWNSPDSWELMRRLMLAQSHNWSHNHPSTPHTAPALSCLSEDFQHGVEVRGPSTENLWPLIQKYFWEIDWHFLGGGAGGAAGFIFSRQQVPHNERNPPVVRRGITNRIALYRIFCFFLENHNKIFCSQWN